MSRTRHFTKLFALLACFAILLFSSIGCSMDSVVAPASGPAGDATGSSDISSTPDGGTSTTIGDVNGQTIGDING